MIIILFVQDAAGQECGQSPNFVDHLLHVVSAGAQGLLEGPKWPCSYIGQMVWLQAGTSGWASVVFHMALSRGYFDFFTA